MPDTIREQIIAACMTRPAVWTTANGYAFDCGTSVFRAQKTIETDDLPAVVIWPQPETGESDYGHNICEMTLRVEAVAEIGDENPSVIQEQLLGDLKKCMLDPTVEISPFMDDVQYATGGPAEQPSPEDTTTAAFADLKITYTELIGNPYQQ